MKYFFLLTAIILGILAAWLAEEGLVFHAFCMVVLQGVCLVFGLILAYQDRGRQ